MGQSIDKNLVQNTVIALQNSSKINSTQADTFLDDFVSNRGCIAQVNTFLNDNDKKFELFMKYFIAHNYPFNPSQRNSRSKQATERSRQQIKDDLDRMMYKQMFKTLESKIEDVPDKFEESLTVACDVAMNKYPSQKRPNSGTKQLWQKLFGITNFSCLIVDQQSSIQSYSSMLNIKDKVKKEENYFLKVQNLVKQFQRSGKKQKVILPSRTNSFFTLFNNKNSKSTEENDYIGIILRKQNKFFLFKVDYQFSIYDYFYLSKQDQQFFPQLYSSILREVILSLYTLCSFQNQINGSQEVSIERYQAKQFSINQYSNEVLSLAKLYLTYEKQTMTEKIKGFVRSRASFDKNTLEFLKQFQAIFEESRQGSKKDTQKANYRSNSSWSVEQTIYDRLLACSRKFISNYESFVTKIDSFKDRLLDQKFIYLNFNKFGEIQFIARPFDTQIGEKIERLWQKGKKSIPEIFPQNSKLFSILKKASKGQFNGQTVQQSDSTIHMKITVRDNGIVQKVQVLIEKCFDQDLCSQKKINSIKNLDSPKGKEAKLLKKVTVNEENKMLQSLQKQNPGISQDSWIGLFLKNNQTEKNQRRSNIKHNSDLITRKQNASGKAHTTITHLKGINNQQMEIDSINLHILKFPLQKLQPFVNKVFEKLEYFKKFSDTRQQFSNFVTEIHHNYQTHKNAFHNFAHGVNVMHSCYILGNLQKNKTVLTPIQMFALVFSGLCHDVGHTGFTNAFEIASKSPKALLYNDKSPLQNHHAYLTFEILRKKKNNFLINLSRKDFDDFRKDVINNILFTDIKEHFDLLKKFQAKAVQTNNQLAKEDHNLLAAMIVHTSDFAGNTKEFQINRCWAERVNTQFINQYRMEGQLGLPQTVFMKDLNKIQVVSKNQAQFLKIIVQPLYKAINSYYVNHTKVSIMANNVQNNIRNWQKIHEDSKNGNIQQNKENIGIQRTSDQRHKQNRKIQQVDEQNQIEQ